MDKKPEALPPTTTDAEILALLEKTNEQYRVYQEINSIANLVRKPAFPPPAAPTPERPLTSSFWANGE